MPDEKSFTLEKEDSPSLKPTESISTILYDDELASSGSSVDPEPKPQPTQEPETTCVSTPSLLTVDLPSLRRSYGRLMSISDQPFQGALINAIISLSQALELQLKFPFTSVRKETNFLHIFIILMENPLLHSPEFLDNAFPLVCRAMSALPVSEQAKLVKIWSEYPKEDMLNLVQALQQMITVRVSFLNFILFS